jgi:hypothetical protein
VTGLLDVAPAYKAEEVLAMRADLAFALVAGKANLMKRAMKQPGSAGREDGEVEHRPDGTTVTHLRSMDSLRALLKGQRGKMGSER